MKLVVCGGRDFTDIAYAYAVLDLVYRTHDIEALISGGAPGADTLAESWAIDRNVPFRRYDAEWTRYGNRAGNIRNSKILDEEKPDLVLALPGGAGTRDMIFKAKERGIRVLLAMGWNRGRSLPESETRPYA